MVESTIRVRMSERDAYYGGAVVNGAAIVVARATGVTVVPKDKQRKKRR